MLRSAILILLDRPAPDRQETVAAAFAVANDLRIVARCLHLDDALALLVLHSISIVVCALDPGPEALSRIVAHGGTLRVARADPVPRARREVAQLAVRMYRSGIDTQEISKILEVTSTEVRRSLFRANVRRRPPPD